MLETHFKQTIKL